MVVDGADQLNLPFHRLSKSTRKCSVCPVYFSGPSIEIPDSARIQGFLNDNLFIPSGSRSCEKHLANDLLKSSAINSIMENRKEICAMKMGELINMMDKIQEELNKLNLGNEESMKKVPLNFDDSHRFTSNEYHTLTGLYYEEFEKICSTIPSVALYNTELRSSRQAVACLLTKLRLGLSNEVLATLHALPDAKSISRILESARLALMKYFVPHNLGLHHISREKLIKERTRPLVKALLADNQEKVCIFIVFPNKLATFSRPTKN